MEVGSLVARMVVREVLKARGSRRLGRLRVGWGRWEGSESEAEEAAEEIEEVDGGARGLDILLGWELEVLLGLGALVEGTVSESVSARSTGANSSPDGEEEELW